MSTEPQIATSPAGSDRPQRADARRNHALILEAAREVFSREGVDAPIDAVAERAGVGVGTLYRHFPNKQALCAAIMADRIGLLVAEADELAGAVDAGPALFTFLASMAEHGARDMALACAFAEAGFELDNVSERIKQPLIDAVDTLLRRAQAAGAVRPDVTAGDLLALFSATCLDADRRPREASLAGCMRRVVFDGLRLPPK